MLKKLRNKMPTKLIITLVVIISYVAGAQTQPWKEYLNKADEYLNKRNYGLALENAQKALEIIEKELGPEHFNYAQALNRIGWIYYFKGDYDKAIEYSIKEVELKKKILPANDASYASAIHNLSTLYQAMGRYTDAEPLLKEALEIKKNTVGEGDTSYAKTLNNFANNYYNMGNYKEAEKLYLQSLEIKDKNNLKGTTSYAYTLSSLGSLYHNLGNYKEACKDVSEALAIMKKNIGENHPETMKAESRLANIYLALGESDKALKLFDAVRAKQKNMTGDAHPDYAQSLYNTALVYWDMKKYNEAKDLIGMAKDIISKKMGQGHPLYSSCLNALGTIAWAQQDYGTAEQYFREAVYIKEKLFGQNNPELAIMIHNLAGVQKDMGNYKSAEENYSRSFNLYLNQIKTNFPFMSEEEKINFYAKIRSKFDMFYCYAMQRFRENPKLLGDMYNFHISIKSLLINNLKKMKEKILSSEDPKLIDTYNKWHDIREKLSRAYSISAFSSISSGINKDSLEKLANSYEKQMSLESFNYLNLKEHASATPITWQDIKSKLQPDEAAVEIVRFNFFSGGAWSDTVFYVALIVMKETKDYPDYVVFNNGKDFEKYFIVNYKKSIAHQIDDTLSYNFFWRRIDEKTAGKKRIFVSLEGVYNKINISSLQSPNGRFIIDDKEIVVLSNTNEIYYRKKEKKQETQYNAVLFGYPTFLKNVTNKANVSIPALNGSKVEVEKIDSLLKDKNISSLLMIEDNATEDRFKLVKNADIIHIATHGFFNPDIVRNKTNALVLDEIKTNENPLINSGLLFAGIKYIDPDSSKIITGTEDDGLLTAYEASNLNLDNTKLVVLSACETGLGAEKNGDGVYGLQRSFLIAGAKSLIMSLWKVNDYVTQELMYTFYKYLLSGETIPISFKKAQMEIKSRYRHPYFWGAFVLVTCMN